jgi:UDP-2,3-diacylglucosamine hydrolase
LSEPGLSGRSLFIADLHLTDERPQANGRFFHFLEHIAPGADALYILGDLFEYWVGDDDMRSSIAVACAQRIKALVASGTPVFFMHGNRDFLLASRYAEQSGMRLLTDPTPVNLYGTATLLMHGDTLCTDDTQYQRLRGWIRKPWMLRLLRALPLNLRHALAGRARAGSEQAKATKAYSIMDVNPEAVAQALHASGATRLIHGHTHRAAHHTPIIDDRTCERWVLPDWYEDGGYLVCTPEACKLFTLD